MVHAPIVRMESMNIIPILDIVHFVVHLRMVHAPIVHSKNTSTAATEKNVYIVDLLSQLVHVLIVRMESMNYKTSVEWANCCPLALIPIFRLPENQSIFSNNLQKGNTNGKR